MYSENMWGIGTLKGLLHTFFFLFVCFSPPKSFLHLKETNHRKEENESTRNSPKDCHHGNRMDSNPHFLS